jgi:hypothetical protein
LVELAGIVQVNVVQVETLHVKVVHVELCAKAKDQKNSETNKVIKIFVFISRKERIKDVFT